MISLADLSGRITDLDAHEMSSSTLWGHQFGESGALLAQFAKRRIRPGDRNNVAVEVVDDNAPITVDLAWTAKGPGAPGAADLSRRLPVMDAMGIKHQLVFPGFGTIGYLIATADDDVLANVIGWEPSTFPTNVSRRDVGLAAVRAYNDWVIESMKIAPDRIRPAGIINPEDMESLMLEAERLLSGGVRALWLPAAVPPCGFSPADPRFDPFWRLAVEAGVPVLLHICADLDFRRSNAWGAAPQMLESEFLNLDTIEVPRVGPYNMIANTYAAQNYIATLVLGGVFDRHPQLKFGAIEYGADWIGPLAETMDRWWTMFKSKLPVDRPSSYVARNIRVTPNWFEPVDVYLHRYPDLVDVYCYSSDYPHIEGGKESHKRFYAKLAPLGDSVLEKFYVTNGELLFDRLPA